MGSEWIELTIGDIADVVGGSTPSTKDPSNFDGDIPWLTPKDLSDPHPRYVTRGARNLSKKGLDSCSARLLPRNSILLSTRAPIGYVAIAANPIATNQGFRSLVLKEGYDHEFVYYWLKLNKFVYYWLKLNKPELERHASGSTFKELSGSALKQIRIRLPRDKNEQRAIARILGALDDKIELNRRMNETLEAMAQALFKSWFVDFDPVVVNALRAGNPIPDKFAERAAHYRDNPDALGLPEDILRLFPARFVDSELGPIPEGWEVGRVSDLGDVICGKTPPTKEKSNYGEDIPFITIPDMHGKVYVTRTQKYLSKKGADSQKKKYLPANSVCVSCIATPGLVALTSEISQTNQQINSVIPNGFSSYYVYNILRRLGDEILSVGSGGSVFYNLNKARFSALKVLLADKRIVEAFHQSVKAVYQKILINEKESHTLAALRDTLLPKLISGELRVPDVEKILEDAA